MQLVRFSVWQRKSPLTVICQRAFDQWTIVILPTSAAVALRRTAATATVAAKATAAARLRLCLVYLERAAVNFSTVQLFDGIFAVRARLHFDKAETARTASFAVFNDIGRRHRAYTAKKFDQVLIGRTPGQISYIKFHTKIFLFLVYGKSRGSAMRIGLKKY